MDEEEKGKQTRKNRKTVMVAIDESEYSHYALEWALVKLKDSIADSHLLLFTAQPNSDIGCVFASGFGLTPPEIQGNGQKVALLLLEKAKDICSKHGIVAETLTEVGVPKEAICEAVEKLNIELLVLGSHGRGAIGRAFLESVSNYCVQNAKCTVLVVKKPA